MGQISETSYFLASHHVGPVTLVERLEEIQQAMDALKPRSDEQGNLKQWKDLNAELQKLKEEVKDTKGELVYFKDVVYTHFKTQQLSQETLATDSMIWRKRSKYWRSSILNNLCSHTFFPSSMPVGLGWVIKGIYCSTGFDCNTVHSRHQWILVNSMNFVCLGCSFFVTQHPVAYLPESN